MSNQPTPPEKTLSIAIRLNGELARTAGRARLGIQLADPATITDLVEALKTQEPNLAEQLQRAIPVVNGRHATADQPISSGQEVALLMPVAGG